MIFIFIPSYCYISGAPMLLRRPVGPIGLRKSPITSK